jgi:hypothetical protein
MYKKMEKTILDQIKHLCKILYARDENPTTVIEEFFHEDYSQCINGTLLNRSDYIHHVIDQRKTMAFIEFEYKTYMMEQDKLFVIYLARGKTIEGDDMSAEIMSYFEFKDKKVWRAHGQVHLFEGNPADIDMGKDRVSV